MRDEEVSAKFEYTCSSSEIQSDQVFDLLASTDILSFEKLIRPRWFRPGMIFLGFLATASHLQLLSDDDYRKLMTEIPLALKALKGNTLNNSESPGNKGDEFPNNWLI